MAEASGRFCKDCKWHQAGAVSGFDKCSNPRGAGVDPVRGETKLAWCETLRFAEITGCGLDAKWFQQRAEQVAA